jgi:hypothetical protein
LIGIDIHQLKDHFLPNISYQQRSLKPLDKRTGLAFERDSKDRTRWFVDDAARLRIWNKVYEQVGSHACIKQVLMEYGGEARELWMFSASSQLTPMKKKKPSLQEMDSF